MGVTLVKTVIAAPTFLATLKNAPAAMARKADDVVALITRIKDKLRGLNWKQGDIDDFIKDFEGSQDLLAKFDAGELEVKAWKAVFDSGLDDALRKNVDALENISNSLDEGLDAIDAVEDAIQTLNKTKWEEIKTFFKRGNDFNRKARDVYDCNEIVLGNGKRLDTYIP